MPTLRSLVPLACIALLVALGWAWAGRVGHPADLEWTEGRAVAAAWRVQHHLPLYDPPTLEWAPVAEPPGHPLVLAGVFAVAGPGVAVARGLSLAAALLAAVGLGLAAWIPTRDRVLSVAAGACWLGCWAVAGTAWDLGGPWALAAAFVGGGLAATCAGGRAWSALGGGLAAAGCATSLAALPVAVGLGLGSTVRSRPDGVAWLGGFIVLAAVGVAGAASVGGAHAPVVIASALGPAGPAATLGALQAVGDGLCVLLACACAGLLARPTSTPARDVAGPMAVGVALAWLALAAGPGRSGTDAFATGLGVGALGAGVARLALHLPRAAARDVAHGLIGLCGLGALLLSAGTGGSLPVFGVAIWGCALVLNASPGPSALPILALAGQLAASTVRTGAVERPDAADREAHERLVRVLERAPQPLWSPYATWLPTEVGGRPSAHAGAIAHLRTVEALDDAMHRFDASVRAGRYGAVITAGSDPSLGDLSATALRTRVVRPGGAGGPVAGPPVALDGIRVPLAGAP